jgi:hypothetical protein
VEIWQEGDHGLEIRWGSVRCQRDVASRWPLGSNTSGSQVSLATGPGREGRRLGASGGQRRRLRWPNPSRLLWIESRQRRSVSMCARQRAMALSRTWMATGGEPRVIGSGGSGGQTLAALSGSNRGREVGGHARVARSRGTMWRALEEPCTTRARDPRAR